MKTETYGKRFSRRVRRTFDDVQEFAAHTAATAGAPDNTLHTLIAHNVEAAQQRLRAAGLPDTAVIHWAARGKRPRPGPGRPGQRACTIEHYVLRERGLAEDSPEGLAARIIWTARQAELATGPQRDAVYYHLGHLVTLARAYSIDSRTATSNARKPRTRKLPDLATLTAEHATLRAQGKARDAASLLGARYGVTAAAVRARLNKKSAS